MQQHEPQLQSLEMHHTCIMNQYVTVFISSIHLKMAIWKMAIQPNRPISNATSEKKSAVVARQIVLSPYSPVTGAMEKYWKKMPKKSARAKSKR